MSQVGPRDSRWSRRQLLGMGVLAAGAVGIGQTTVSPPLADAAAIQGNRQFILHYAWSTPP